MEYYQGRLCISGFELIVSEQNPDGFIRLSDYQNWSKRKKIHIVRRSCRNTPALIAFDSLPRTIQEEIKERIGLPESDTVPQNALEECIVRDTKARDFYNEYRLPDGNELPIGVKEEYCNNAEVLNAMHVKIIQTKAYRRARGGNTRGVFESVASLLNGINRVKYPHSLPTNPKRLREKYSKYKREGYISLIHKGYGNKNTEKLTEDARRWILARWSNMVDRVTSPEHLLVLYNDMAGVKGWKKLQSVATIRNFLWDPDIKHTWYSMRYGDLKAKEKFELQNSTRMPSMRDSLWYSDGTKLNYYYLNEEGKMETCQVYEVMDAYSEVLLGYHISKTEDYEAQYRAYKMAVQTSGRKPYQIGFDNQGGHKKLIAGNFLGKVARLAIKTKPYNGKSKTIESAFGRMQAQIMKKDWFFTGQNITTKTNESRANLEFIMANKSNLPSLEEVKAVYAKRRKEWNESVHFATGKRRIDMYLESQNPLTPEVQMWDMVDVFWIMRPDPVMMTAYGISITEKKVKYDYLIYRDGKPDVEFLRRNIDKKFQVKFDPDDMSMIYLYDTDSAGRLRFVVEATSKVTVSRGKQEQTSDDLAWLHMVDQANKAERIKARDYIDAILDEFAMTPEHYGLISPGKKGGKKGKNEFGRAVKAISNRTRTDKEESEKSIYDLM